MRSVHDEASDGDTTGEHLSRETLARLVDDVASSAERRHLESCGRCLDELSALAAQTRALSSLPDIDPPPEAWEAIETRMRAHVAPAARGPVAGERATAAARGTFQADPASRVGSGWLRAAASAALFLAGGVTGAMLASGLSGGTDSPAPAEVASVVDTADGPEPRDVSLSDSEALVGMAEDLYMDALFDYRQRVAETDPALARRDPLGRLVMLENLLAATEAAVREAPADPFFNGVLASATAEHRAVVAEMATFANTTW